MRVVHMNPFSVPRSSAPKTEHANFTSSEKKPASFDIKKLAADDWLLLGIIAILVMDGSTDYMLLIALGYLFVAGL